MQISDEAVEAARGAYLREFNYDENAGYIARLILEAAAPHMLREAWDAGAMAMGMQTGDSMSDDMLTVMRTNPYRSQA